MKKLEIIAAVVIVIATILVLNTCSTQFELPEDDPEISTETTLE